jgi:hypothetical protein
MGTDRTKIRTEDLAAAAVEAAGTQTSSVPNPVTPPLAAGTSPIDAAAALVAGSIQTLTASVNGADAAAATEQTAALTESPPALQQQDETHAESLREAGAGTTAVTFPILHAAAPVAGKVWDA